MLESSVQPTKRGYVLWFTVPLAGLIAIVSLAGLLDPELYSKETSDWAVQSVAQDAVDLFLILPVLVLAGLYTHRGEKRAAPIWGGTLLYLVYTFLIYCFSVHFNALFLAYVAILGIAAYATAYAARTQLIPPSQPMASGRPARVIGIYFIVVAILFYLLWLADVVPAITGGYTPSTIVAAGLPTNPVHVLDLALFLPGVLIVGVLLRRGLPLGMMLAPVILVFFVLMDLTITVIFIAQQSTGAEVRLPALVLMPVMAVLSLAGLAWLLKSIDG